MKRTFILASLCLSLLSMQTAQAASLWESAKNKAQSGYQSVKQRWNNLDESTKRSIIGAGAATLATAGAAGAGYAAYKSHNSNKNDPLANRSLVSASEGFEELVPGWENFSKEEMVQGTRFEGAPEALYPKK